MDDEQVYRRELAACVRDLAVLSTEVREMRISLNDKHEQNKREQEKSRRDVHNIRSEMQIMTDKFSIKLDSIGIALAASKGEKDYRAYVIPIVLSVATVIILVLELLKKGGG